MTWQNRYMARFYPADRGFTTGTRDLWALCSANSCKSPDRDRVRILEVGAGPDNQTTEFLATLGDVHGIDMDPAVLTNRALSHATVMGGDERFPVAAGQWDLCVSDYVLEHVKNPALHFSEVWRVLRPGGAYVFRTPNLRHYVTLVARCTPHWVHQLVANRLRALPQEAHEPYPAWYRANSRAALRRLSLGVGFRDLSIAMIEKEPQYGLVARPLFLAFVAYERAVNLTRLLEGWRANILGVARK